MPVLVSTVFDTVLPLVCVLVYDADYDRARPFAVGPSLPMGGCGTVGGSISGTFG